MNATQEYIQDYKNLFNLIFEGKTDSTEAKNLRIKMGILFSKLPGKTDEEKMSNFIPSAMDLYNRKVGNLCV